MAVAAACTTEGGPENVPGTLDGLPGEYVGPSSDDGVPAEDVPCDDGRTSACSILLGDHDNIVSCYKGERTCVDGTWSSCGNGSIQSVDLSKLASRRRYVGNRKQVATASTTVGGSLAQACQNNPCDPSCLLFASPTEGLIVDAGTTTFGTVTTVTRVDGGNGWDFLDWTTGNISDYPRGLVKKGLIEPCESSSHCQFNSQCINPKTAPSCIHSKCQIGDALDYECDDLCVEQVCTEKPDCCTPREPGFGAPCMHDACDTGGPLEAQCDQCVYEICQVSPECCEVAWDASCVNQIASVCGNDCDCGVGQIRYDGNCYFYESRNQSWSEARNFCASFGPGWDVVSIEDQAEQDFVTDKFYAGEFIWTGLTDGAPYSTDNAWVWANGDPPGVWDATVGGTQALYTSWAIEPDKNTHCAVMSDFGPGDWIQLRCDANHDLVCEGPPSAMQGPVDVPDDGGPWTAIPLGSTWKYHSGSDPGATWKAGNFDDSAWAQGPAELGFGDGDEDTVLARNDPSYYFRHQLNIGQDLKSANVQLVFDDAFIVFINGQLALAKYVASDATHSQWANVGSLDNETFTYELDKSLFTTGLNTIAVVVKNLSPSSDDLTFDLRLNLDLCPNAGCPPPGGWQQECVDMVATTCGATCDTPLDPYDEPEEWGICDFWLPGETDGRCSGADLAVGPACDGNVPVCNHGTQTAPAGVRIVHFPANSQQYPKCLPDQTHPQMYECFTPKAIRPGECVNVTTCPNLSGNREIMVNPQGVDWVPECDCKDNWSLYNSSECEIPKCAGQGVVAELKHKPVDIIFIVDNSSAMTGEIFEVQQNINKDFADIIAASGVDYRVIMMSRYGDSSVPVGNSALPICVRSPLGGHDCSDPINQGLANNSRFFHFSTDVQDKNALCRLIQGMAASDEVTEDAARPWTPVSSTGYLSLLRPEARKAFVVITRQNVNCSWGGYTFNSGGSVSGGQTVANNFDAALLALSPAQFGTASARNYVFHSIVGMQEYNPDIAPWPTGQPIQTARCAKGPTVGAGTGYQALSIKTGGVRFPTCQTPNYNAVFQQLARIIIEGVPVSCSFDLRFQEGESDRLNRAGTSLAFKPSDGSTPTAYNLVSDASACSANGFYYEDDDTITLCPTPCAEVQADPTGHLAVDVLCIQGDVVTTTTTSTEGVTTYSTFVQRLFYEPDCGVDHGAQWGFFTYDATTPADSSITFRVRTAETREALDVAEFSEVAIASAANGTEKCGLLGPEPCPVDLFDALGGSPRAYHEQLELQVELTPGADPTNFPTLGEWQITFSCVPDQ